MVTIINFFYLVSLKLPIYLTFCWRYPPFFFLTIEATISNIISYALIIILFFKRATVESNGLFSAKLHACWPPLPHYSKLKKKLFKSACNGNFDKIYFDLKTIPMPMKEQSERERKEREFRVHPLMYHSLTLFVILPHIVYAQLY